jgi:hypothetical protein
VNPIAAKNNTIVTLHLDDEECCGERLAPYGELHGDDTLSLHQVAPHNVKRKVSLTCLSCSLPSFLKMEYDIRLMTAPPSMSIMEIGFPSMWA